MPADKEQHWIRVRDLKPGQKLARDLFDPSGLLLLKAGTPISARWLELLQRRQLLRVRLQEEGPVKAKVAATEKAADEVPAVMPPHATNGSSRRLDNWVENQSQGGVQCSMPTHVQKPQRMSITECRKLTEEARVRLDSAERHIEVQWSRLSEGKSVDWPAIGQLVDELQQVIDADPTLALINYQMRYDPHEWMARHAVESATLAMAMAHHMGFSKQHMLDVGFAGLVSDVGMLAVPMTIRNSSKPLSVLDRLEIENHPVYTVDMLEQAGTSMARQLIAFQVHERVNASGYPRRRSGPFIHPLARVLAVADTYLSLREDRPHRRAVTAYDSMVSVLKQTHQGRFDAQATRALLDVAALFPVGSYVRLSDQSIARVFRANPAQHTKPVVIPCDEHGNEKPWDINLKETRDLQVIEALDMSLAA